MRGDSSMLTLDEFLRETSAASATRDEAERHLNNLLTLRREMAAERAAETGRSRIPHSRDRRRDWVSISPPHPDGPDESASWRTLVEHTPAGRARILSALPSGAGPIAATPPRPVPYTYTPMPAASQESFDTLVGQIRRIGALQDFMLSGIVEGESVPAATAASSNETATEEYGTGVAGVGGAVGARVEHGAGTGGEEAERNAVAALRVREARLRAMQTRIDLLASEFALLRNSRRELRWVSNIFSIFAYFHQSLQSIITIALHTCNFFPKYS